MATSLAPKPAATPFTGVILAVILGSPVGQSFVPAHIPLGSSARSSAWGAGFGWRGTAARGIRSMAMYADVGIQGGALQVGIGDEAGWCGGTSRRRRTRLYAGKKGKSSKGGKDFFNMKNIGSSVPEEDRNQLTEEEQIFEIMFATDPDAPNQGPVYYGDIHREPEFKFIAPEAELRFNESYLAFCIDREATEDEEINFPFWGIRITGNRERMIWARTLTRGLRNQQDRESTIAWDRSILSPRKQKIIGNMMNIRAKSKEAAMRLLEADPFYKKGLYGSISVYRFPHSTEGAHSWAVGRKPYVALLMDKPEMRNVKKEKFLARRHLHYLELARRVSGYGPIYDSDTSWDDKEVEPLGSLLFFNAPNDDFARELVETDPYHKAGVYQSVYIARFNELDLDGRYLIKPRLDDPLRDKMIELGYGERGDLPVDPKWRPFSALTWLEKEHDKKVQEEYNEKRAQLYEERDERIDWEESHADYEFKPGFYVYMGPRNESEWYDYWPHRFTPGVDGWGPGRFTLENSVLPADIYEDELK